MFVVGTGPAQASGVDYTPLMDAELVALVGLCLAYRTRGKLAVALARDRSALAVAKSEEWCRPPPEHALHRVLHILRLKKVQVVPVWAWPEPLLRSRPLAPAFFVRGDVRLLWRTGVAVVGAREAHTSATEWAYAVAAAHAVRGELIISGGARGVDAAAHRAAIDYGATLAYLGAPADAVYPRHNRELFNTMLREGHTLVSEHLPDDFVGRSAHAVRNRFIAAHARRIYIAEADVASGSMGTAAYATAYGVPIQVSPPNVGVRRSGLELLLADRHAAVYGGAGVT